MDPANPVARLCAEGMSAEGLGQAETAASLFKQAWEQSSDDYERCIAAHYVARQQPSLEEALSWNRKALDCAASSSDPRLDEFFPSLYLNMGKAHEELGNLGEACAFYDLAAQKANTLPAGPYGRLILQAIERGLKRTEAYHR
jgi:tetratricopeptide (TPR) repeat protein